MKIMKKINTQEIPVKSTFVSLWMTVAMVLAFTGCSEEDLVQPTNGEAGTLHITSVSVDGQQVGGRSRAVADDGTQYDYEYAPYNQSLNSFGNGDEIKLVYTCSTGDDDPPRATATYNNGTWTIDANIAPSSGKSWDRLRVSASANDVKHLMGNYDGYAAVAAQLGIVAGTGMDAANICLATDDLSASTEGGSIDIETNPLSPILGATTINFKHSYRALLRLPIPEGGFNVAGTYVVNGTAHHVTGLATLWAMVKDGEYTYYFPLTKVGSNLQSIIYLSWAKNLVGFKAVLYATKVAAENTPMVSSTGSEPSTITLDLPFKVGGSASTGIELEENTQYPLTLKISPASAEVNFTIPNGKPGWNVSESQEQELSNANNEFDLKYIAGEGGAAGTFMVKTAQGLQALNKWMMGKINTDAFESLVSNGSDIPDNVSKKSCNITLIADITLPEVSGDQSNWIPITSYTGIFDGNGKRISNLTIVDDSTSDLGLFGSLKGTQTEGTGSVMNVNLVNVQITSTTTGSVGGIVGCITSSGNYDCKNSVSGCRVISGTINVPNAGKVGGIVGLIIHNLNGMPNTTISNCENAASIVGNSYVGGIVGNAGSMTEVSITGCANTGTINGKEYIGGIVGCFYGPSYSWHSVTQCNNCGTVVGNTEGTSMGYVGGIAGSCRFSILEGCTNMAQTALTVNAENSTSSSYIGGIVGLAANSFNIQGCMNHTDIAFTCNNTSNAKNYVAGIVAFVSSFDKSQMCDGIIACGNTGDITITGKLSSGSAVGGISASPDDCTFYGCWTKDVVESGTGDKDGFGYVSTNNINGCYTAAAKTEGTDQAFINGKTGYTDDETSDEGMSMNKALETLFYASGKPGASLSTKYYWKANTNGGWPTLTTTAPTMPTGN